MAFCAPKSSAMRRGKYALPIIFVPAMVFSRKTLFMLLALPPVAFAGLLWGSVSVPVAELWNWLFQSSEPSGQALILSSRALRTATALIGGASLSLAGWLMQTLFRNPLAGPSVLGISSGSSLFVAMLVLGGGWMASSWPGYLAVAMAAMAGAVFVLLLVLLVSGRFADHVSLLIFGLMIGYVVNAVESILQFGAGNESLRTFIFWGMGSFSSVFDVRICLFMLASLVVGLVVTLRSLAPLNMYLLGDDYAQSMGMRIRRFRITIILVVGVLTGVTTAFCGPVAFIGLAVPHIVRLLFRTADHYALCLPVVFAGAMLTLVCDIISRAPWGGQVLPLNAVTCLMGAPVILFILFRAREKGAIL